MKTIAVDFTKADDSVYGAIRKGLDGLNIGLLVNNVGMAPEPKPFGMIQDEQFLNNILNCNALSLCRMSHIVVPQMAKRRCGVIINIGSITSAGPSPFVNTYGATKKTKETNQRKRPMIYISEEWNKLKIAFVVSFIEFPFKGLHREILQRFGRQIETTGSHRSDGSTFFRCHQHDGFGAFIQIFHC